MPVSAIYGLPRKGKSHFLLFYGLFLVNDYEKRMVCNFIVNPFELITYCRLAGYWWILNQIESGQDLIYYCDPNDSAALENLLAIPDSVVLFDEAGIYFPARQHQKTSKVFLANLCQAGHHSQYVMFAAQNLHQVDVQIRYQCEEIYHCNGISLYSKKLKNQFLVQKMVRRFMPEQYEQWLGDPKLRKNPLKTMLLSNKTWKGVLSCMDARVFDIYNSFARLELAQQCDFDGFSYVPETVYNFQGDFVDGFFCLRGKLKDIRGKYQGYNLKSIYKKHSLSFILSKFACMLPSNFKERIFNLDRHFCNKIKQEKFSKFEKGIIYGTIGFLVLSIYSFIF